MRNNLLLIAVLFSFLANSQTPIIIDGNFDDWEDRQPVYTDSQGDANLDFQRIWVESDDQFFFFSFELNTEIELSENNSIELYLDTDGDASTGNEIAGIGAEIIYEFGNRNGDLWIRGSAIRAFHNDLGLFTAPTVTSDRFEIAIRRDEAFYGEDVFSSDKVKIYLRDNRNGGDQVPDIGTLEIDLNDADLGELPTWSFEKKSVSDVRILSYNAERDAIFNPSLQNSFRRIIQATRPDILAFQEIYDSNGEEVADLVERFLPSEPGERWYFSDVQPDIRVVSRFPILREEQLQGGGSSSSGNGAFLIDLGPEYPTNLLLVNAHLACCNNDIDRQGEIDEIMGFLRNSKDETSSIPLNENTPIVIAGDMNMVGDNQQLTTFLTGDIRSEFINGPDFAPDWDGSDLEDAIPPTTGYPAAFTWFSETSSFNPGRLDFVIYTGSVLDLKNSFSLFTRPLSDSLLQANGLFAEDAVAASDHLPLIADFEVKDLSSVNVKDENKFDFKISPNPFSESFSVSFSLEKSSRADLAIYDLGGRRVQSILNENLSPGTHQISLENFNFPKGIYFLKIKTDQSFSVLKMVRTE